MSAAEPGRQVNEGIQATNVHADVLAVGHGARATKYAAADAKELSTAIERLQAVIQGLNLDRPAKEAIDEDLAELHAAADGKEPKPDRAGRALQSLSGKLKMVGVVLSEVVSLSEPVQRIAELLRIPLHMLGW
jgi:hypothetical protein